jgi:hypothetical protein
VGGEGAWDHAARVRLPFAAGLHLGADAPVCHLPGTGPTPPRPARLAPTGASGIALEMRGWQAW